MGQGTSRPEGGGGGPRGAWLVATLLIAAVALYEKARVVATVGREVANDDDGILWVAARDIADGQLHQPTFYGQAYGTILDALPIAALHAAGVGYWTATPLALAGLTLASWA